MRPQIWTVAVLAACGGPPTPKLTPPPPAIAPTTCAEAGVILRGPIDSLDPAGGSAREAIIAQACTADQWAANVVECVGASRTPETCLAHLPAAAKASYEAKLAAWTAKYPAAPPKPEDDDAPAAAATETACEDVVGALDRFSGDLTVEHDWAVAARKRAIQVACLGDQWAEVAKHCITALDAGAPTLAPVWACVDLDAKLSAQKASYLDADARVVARAQQIAKAKQKPATIACGKVVAAYYADAAWKGKLDDAKPADRKKQIAGSRTAMQKACTADKDTWDPTLRACIVASSGDQDCFADTKVAARAWGFPALEIKLAALPPKCVEYRKELEKYQKCNKDGVDANTIATVLDMMAEEAHSDPNGIGEVCASGLDQLKQMTQDCH